MRQLNVKRLTRETIECSVTRGCGGIAPGRRSALRDASNATPKHWIIVE